MATKEDMAEELNEALGTSLDFCQMEKEEIDVLHTMLETGELAEMAAKHVAKEKGSEKYKEIVDEWYPGKFAAHIL